MRRIPIFATLVVLLAVATMVSLGFWQLRRLHEKEALLASYSQARGDSAEIKWPRERQKQLELLYHRVRLTCVKVTGHSSIAGRSASDELGMAQTAQCTTPDGGNALVVIGWAEQPNAGMGWQGGEVHGRIAPGPRLVADPPLAGLKAVAAPDPAEIPNNHLSYAFQWFFFAATALVIYAIALRKRLR